MTANDPPVRVDSRPRLSGRAPIRAAEGLLGIEPVLVPGDLPLDAVIERAGASPSTRVLGVVDAEGVLIGVVRSHDLVAAVVGRLAPGALLADVSDVAGIQEYDRIVEAHTALELARPPAAVSSTATVAETYHLMHDRNLSGVYVVDEAGHPTGYIDGLELAAWVESAGGAASADPPG